MADVFISYKQRMRPRVAQIARALEGLGLSVWFDAELQAGRSFGAVINAELARAGCVLVCWTPDAFAPEDGTEVSWVEAEATVARERKVIVPIMLERTPLKAPWNMFHTERMMDWTGGADDPAWFNLLEAIGRHVGRPGLAEYARAVGNPAALAAWATKYLDDPLAAKAAAPGTISPVTRARTLLRRATRIGRPTQWLLGATLFNTLAAILVLLRFGPDAEGNVSYLINAGPLISSAVWALALWRSKTLDIGRALFTIMAAAIGYVVAIFSAPLVEPTMALFATEADQARGFINGTYSGFGGAFVALGGIALLIGNVGRDRWISILLGSLALGLVCGILGTGVLKSVYTSNFFWISIVWTFSYGLLLTRLAAGRSASTM
ncbi:MAG: toll/interleukin-1 receptor domain-containing protein [Devosia nanyangense]|uniref:Toll/interleukin-1 receptor domain-containing protein n=1 Tax=Devosia nanyangense TaxID=1228055 RepID=A0A933L5Y9_9HYPH|nr:toll/interleukin-1 receptor domain-containing protein [Devosia nanyangense]